MLSNKLDSLYNRITKNQKKLRPLIKKWQTNAYRLYDKDIPELPYQIDLLGTDFWIMEKGVHQDKIGATLRQENHLIINNVLNKMFNCQPDHIWWQSRQSDGVEFISQQEPKEIIINEGLAKFYLKLGTYRDHGLFLDHRPLRLHLAQLQSKPKVLNLFCYTSTFSVHLALNGSLTTNVDLSNTYLDWSKKNFLLNKISLSNQKFIQADILQWLNSDELKPEYDLIILDPPSFSNSKRMGEEILDIQRDHKSLIEKCLKLLKADGVLYFSTNLRTFKLDADLKSGLHKIEDITLRTIPEDFRDKKIHQCFKITSIPV